MKSDCLDHIGPEVWSEVCSNEWVSGALPCAHAFTSLLLGCPIWSQSCPARAPPHSHSCPRFSGWGQLVERSSRCPGAGDPRLTLALVCSGTAVTVETASALGAAPSRFPGPPWGPQVSGAGWGSGQREGAPASHLLWGLLCVGREPGVSERSRELGISSISL